MKVHPDVNTSGRPEDFVRVTNAYNYLVEADKGRRVAWNSSSQAAYNAQQFRRAKQNYKFSPGVIAVIISLPLVLGGIRAGLAYDRVTQTASRPYGLLQPPVNPFLSPAEARALPVKKRKAKS